MAAPTIGPLAPESTRTFSLATISLLGWILSRVCAVVFLKGVPPDNPVWTIVHDPLWDALLAYAGVWTGVRTVGGMVGKPNGNGNGVKAAVGALAEIDADVHAMTAAQTADLHRRLQVVEKVVAPITGPGPAQIQPPNPSVWPKV